MEYFDKKILKQELYNEMLAAEGSYDFHRHESCYNCIDNVELCSVGQNLYREMILSRATWKGLDG